MCNLNEWGAFIRVVSGSLVGLGFAFVCIYAIYSFVKEGLK